MIQYKEIEENMLLVKKITEKWRIYKIIGSDVLLSLIGIECFENLKNIKTIYFMNPSDLQTLGSVWWQENIYLWLSLLIWPC